MNVIRTLVLGICLGFICGGRKDKSYPQPKEYNTNRRPTWRPPIGSAPPDASVEDDVRRVGPPVAAGRHREPPRHRRGKRHSFIRGRERGGRRRAGPTGGWFRVGGRLLPRLSWGPFGFCLSSLHHRWLASRVPICPPAVGRRNERSRFYLLWAGFLFYFSFFIWVCVIIMWKNNINSN